MPDLAARSDLAWVSPRQAWRLTGLSRDEIYRRIHAGELPHLKIGNKHCIPVRALEDLVTSVCAGSAAPKEG